MAEAEAARAGQSLDEYVARLILSQADRPIDAELLKGLRSPVKESSAVDFAARKQRVGGSRATRPLLGAGKDNVLSKAEDFDAPIDALPTTPDPSKRCPVGDHFSPLIPRSW